MKPKLKCETHKPQGRHKGPGGKRRKRKDSPPSHVDSKDKDKNDSVTEDERERKTRQDDRGYLQSWFPKNRVAQNIADKTRRAGCGGQL